MIWTTDIYRNVFKIMPMPKSLSKPQHEVWIIKHLMNKIIFLLPFLIAGTLSSKGQDVVNNDTLKATCDGPVFYSCEEMPYLKNGKTFFANTLKEYLQRKNEYPKPGKISLQLTILQSGEIKYVTILKGEVDKVQELIKALKRLSNQWSPGKQNGHIVCCYQNIDFAFRENKIKITLQ